MDLTDVIASTILMHFGGLHRVLRADIESLSDEALAWTPAPDTSSISTLVVHLLGSEGEAWNTIRGKPKERDRDGEFEGPALAARELVGRIDQAERVLAEEAPLITADDLGSMRPRPHRGQTQSGLGWLLQAFAHANEHYAQIRLTKQLYEQSR